MGVIYYEKSNELFGGRRVIFFVCVLHLMLFAFDVLLLLFSIISMCTYNNYYLHILALNDIIPL